MYLECLRRSQVGGIDLSHTRWTNGILESWENSSLDYLDIFGQKAFQWNRHGFDLGILMGAFLLELHEKLGIGFMTHPIQVLRRMPGPPQNALEAASKVQKAPSIAAKRNLDEFFITRWR